ncbi:MAG: L-2-amino-thiazoline-4-carboxylic acid hydrolase [Lachnospiraceae bacterium]|nr:L-2-amino-thiazoline-4-carboxylic acid hydrolase [Lachnospiraceae bacterium]
MRTVRKTSIFPASKKTVFTRLLKLRTLQYIAYPYATFTPLNGTDSMAWEAGSTSRFKFRLFGIIPFGTHTIHVMRFGMDEGIYTHEGNEYVPVWDHEIILEELPGNKCRYTDKVDIDAGWKTIFIWMWANCFYAHRQRKWIKLLKRKHYADRYNTSILQMGSFLGSRYEPSEVRRYIRSAQEQYEKWIKSMDEPSSSRLKTMKNTILPRVALYAALKEDDQNADAVLDDYVRDVAGPMMHQMYARMEKIPGFWVIFKNLLKIITDKSDKWECESRKEKDRLYLNIRKCLWHDTCTRVGYPECCRFFCECDNYTYGGLKKMGFTRTQTLGTGGELCDFVMYRKRRSCDAD